MSEPELPNCRKCWVGSQSGFHSCPEHLEQLRASAMTELRIKSERIAGDNASMLAFFGTPGENMTTAERISFLGDLTLVSEQRPSSTD